MNPHLLMNHVSQNVPSVPPTWSVVPMSTLVCGE